MKVAARHSSLSRLLRICAGVAAFAAAACSSHHAPEQATASHREAVTQCSGSSGAGGTSSATDTDPGALIVDLGTTPQTQGNALKPYGLAYDLVKNQKIPLIWAYNTSKTANTDVDFSVDGRAFRGSAFVIPGAFVKSAQTTVSKWIAQGVQVYGPTKAAFSPPTYFKRLTGFPNIVLDPQYGAVAQGYLTAAGFPTFPVQLPTTLNTCQDMFVLPHADPTWANHGNLKSFVTNGGFLWSGCHAVSVLESIDGNADGVPDMDFLSTTGLINFANHTGGYPPYNYSASALSEPVMQFLGGVDSALSGGSEQVYLPFLGGAWRPTTRVSVWDPDQPEMLAGKSPGPAVKIAYGRGYGLSSSGVVMYQGSHNFAGSSADQIAAQRAFLNFILWNAADKSVVVNASVPAKLLGATQVNLTSTASSSGSISSYQWTSSCGGTFGTPTTANTTFTAPAASIQNTPCVIRLTATDSCSRVAFDARDTTVLGLPDLAVTVSASTNNPTVGQSLDYTVTANDIGGLPTVSSVVSFTVPPSSQYTVNSITTTPSGIVCTPRVAPNANTYDCPVGDLDGCSPVTIVVKGSVTASGCFSASVTGTTTSSDVDLGSNSAAAQACSITTGDHPILLKSVFPASPATVNPGGTLSYTLTLFNGGTTTLDNIHIYDPYPTTTTTYVASSTSVTYQQYVATIADSFAGNVYTGSTGQLPWAGNWTEISDGSGRATTGSIRVKTANCPATSCPNMIAKNDGAGIQRALSLASASAATLSFTYRVPTQKNGQNALVQISGDSGATWRTASTISLATKVSTSTPLSVAFLASELTANARIRITLTGTSQALFVPDDFVVQLTTATSSTVTSAGSTPSATNSFDLTENLNGLLSLRPGASITATFRTTVNSGVAGGTAIPNTANVKTTQTGATATSSNTVSVSTASSASSPPVAFSQSLTFLEDAAGSTLGITQPTDADTVAGSLNALVQKIPQTSQATLYLADGVTPVSVGQTLTMAQLTALKISGAADFNGAADPFVYVVSDPQGNVSAGTASLTFTAVNDAPVAYVDQDVTQKGSAVVLDAPGSNDTDVDGNIDDSLCDLDPVTAGQQASFTNAAGTWVLDTSAASATFGQVTYTPAAGFTGVASLSYTSSDDGTPLPAKTSAAGSNCASNPSGACISVRVNAPPLAVADTFTVTSIGGATNVTNNDSDPDGIVDVTAVDLDTVTTGIQTTLTVVGKGTFTSLLTGQVRFVPVAGFFGTASTSYTVDDFDGGTSNAVTLSVTVSGCSTAADCNDGNDCTSDVCSSGTCVNAKLSAGASCNDQNSSTKNDVCDGAGSCAGTPYTCTPSACESASVPNGTGCVGTPVSNGTACNDGNACTQTDSCQSGVCTGSNPVTCGAASACHVAPTCVPATGLCTSPAQPDGTGCNDGNGCTQSDTCQSGVCVGTSPITCTAIDQCHSAGTCAPATGLCSTPSLPNGTGCNDGNACTQSDSCQSGVCTGAAPVTCTAVDQCHVAGTCSPATGLCSSPSKVDGSSCNDGNACTQTDTCQSGTCSGGNAVVCNPIDQCHNAGTCNPSSGTCSSPSKPNGSACSDGDACTQTDTCQSGTCSGTNPVVCSAVDQCHNAGTCNPTNGTCSSPSKSDGTACNDGNACTQTDTCQSGICAGNSPITCTALDQCHAVGTCSPATGVCSTPAKPDGSSCSDGNACSQTDTCQSGTCSGTNPVVCSPVDQCHNAGTCDPTSGACSSPNKTDGTTCNDGNACTQTDTCQSGTCGGSNPVVCNPVDQCHDAGTCSPATGTCSSPPKTNGSACSDNDACTQSDSCQSGSCVGSNPVVCSAVDQCHAAGVCSPASGSCSTPNLPDGSACNDGNGCTQADSCSSGVCTGSNPVLCTALDQCHSAGTCSPATGVCTQPAKIDGTGCNDGDGCTQADICQSGTCTAGPSVVCATPDKPVCSSPSGVCGCNVKSDCLAAAPVCDVSTHTCFGCLVDSDCSATQFCNSETRTCSEKLPNAAQVPSLVGHTPALNGTCNAGVAVAVCSSAVCDTLDNACGYPNGSGSCTISNGSVVCRTAVCDGNDGKCGYADGDGPCNATNAATVCRSGVCSVSGVCQAPAACTVDGDCASTQFCNTETKVCTAKLPNATAVPTINGHSPVLDGTCNASVGTAVCITAACDDTDDRCGYKNGHGSCLPTSKEQCRSDACDANDHQCGYADGDGPCTAQDAATVCRSGVCSVSGVCQKAGSCTVDGDCASTQFCDSVAHLCTAKLSNATHIPDLAGHDPVLDGSCTDPVAKAVCSSAVCDTSDNACGFANGTGPCLDTNATVVCRSSVCDASDGKCGFANDSGPCTKFNAATTCRSGVCSISGVCQAAGSCTVDGDCESTQFCNTETRLCVPKLANGAQVPTIAKHDPALDGSCTELVAVAVCISEACDTGDNRCGYANGDGQCTQSDAATLCRTGVCDSGDGKCGYADGSGPCATDSVCRSLSCSVSGVCQPAGACTVDGDCSALQFCNSETRKCVQKLSNGVALPTIAGHTPPLTGMCNEPASLAVCLSAVCDPADNACGYANGVGPCMVVNQETVCRSGVCDPLDAKCGYANGSGPCTKQDAATTCRSGACSGTGVCEPVHQCSVDGDCAATQFCNTESGNCTAKLPNGTALPQIPGHQPELTGHCSAEVAAVVCISAVCDTADDACGYSNGHGPCTTSNASEVCRTGFCDGEDNLCGYADGNGPCSEANAPQSCRSQTCSETAKLCRPATGCVVDADCSHSDFCDTERLACTPKLKNGKPIPTVAGHTPALTGQCNDAVGKVVCVSAVCDATDDLCGLPDGAGPCSSESPAACRSGVCTDGLCGPQAETPDAGGEAGSGPTPDAGSEAGGSATPPGEGQQLRGGGCACTAAGQNAENARKTWAILLLSVAIAAWRRRRPARAA
ncbi:MAG TPA: Ig-like domain-containing protein [Polyangiaceae bacterium]|nr:Ig-like domain-containing protein [Polyangiaceae bacterium]